MPYGYGVGFVRATSDIPVRNLLVSVSTTSGIHFVPFKILGTNTNYQVPSNKTFLMALERRNTVSTNVSLIEIGYADDASGTNYNKLVDWYELGLLSDNTERYYIFTIPSSKFIILKYNSGANGLTVDFTLMGFEV
jgi:hypothetical protein